MKLGTETPLSVEALEAAMHHLNEGDERDVDVLRAAIGIALRHDGLILIRALCYSDTGRALEVTT